MAILKRACAPPPKKAHYFDETETVQNRVYRSLKIWSMYADLEESFGTVGEFFKNGNEMSRMIKINNSDKV